MRNWYLTKDGDVSCMALFRKHYSHRHYKDGRMVKYLQAPEKKLF